MIIRLPRSFRVLAAVLTVAVTGSAAAQDGLPMARYVEGQHYTVLPSPVDTPDDGTVEVMEYFSYACPHCFTFDPQLHAWVEELPEHASFRRTPAIFNRMYQWFAQVYYTADVLGVLDESHQAFFELIHERRQMPNSIDKLAAFYEDYGVDPADFEKAFTSFGVRTLMQQAVARGRRYQEGGVGGVPTLVVDGRFVIDAGQAGSYENMLEIADWLVEQVHAEAATMEQPVAAAGS
jgi:thiol:disulfide interchange protein DsbA